MLTGVLTLVAVSTAALGALLGWYATRHALRPLTAVADAAQEIAGGDPPPASTRRPNRTWPG